MNKLERIGLVKAMEQIREVRIRLDEKEEGRQEHTRLHTEMYARQVQEILDALLENDKQLKNEPE